MWDWLWAEGMSLAWWVPIYVWISLCLHLIAVKTDTQYSWFAWIPVVNIFLLCKMAGQSGWWFFLFLVPIVNIIVFIYVWMNIAEALNRPSWLGIFMIVPVLNLIILGIIALGQ